MLFSEILENGKRNQRELLLSQCWYFQPKKNTVGQMWFINMFKYFHSPSRNYNLNTKWYLINSVSDFHQLALTKHDDKLLLLKSISSYFWSFCSSENCTLIGNNTTSIGIISLTFHKQKRIASSGKNHTSDTDCTVPI